MKILPIFASCTFLIIGCSSIPEKATERNYELEYALNMKINQYSFDIADRLESGTEKDVIRESTSAVKASLIDPDSAQFRGVKIIRSDGKIVVCGQVNSKNRMGGYIGYQNFIAGTKGFIMNFNNAPCLLPNS